MVIIPVKLFLALVHASQIFTHPNAKYMMLSVLDTDRI